MSVIPSKIKKHIKSRNSSYKNNDCLIKTDDSDSDDIENDFVGVQSSENYSKQFIIIIVSYSCAFVCGCGAAFPSPVLTRMKSAGILDYESQSWYTSLLSIGAIFGGPIAGTISNRYGRKMCILLSTVPLALCWFLTCAADIIRPDNAYMLLYMSRMSMGVGFSMALLVLPAYIDESVSEGVRGLYASSVNTGICSGVMVIYSLGTWVPWQYISALSAIPLLVTVISMLQCPESPRWLFQNHKYHEGTVALEWLRGSAHDSLEERNNILSSFRDNRFGNTLNKDKRSLISRLKLMRRRNFYRPFIICLILHTAQQVSSINSILNYSGEMLLKVGFGADDIMPLLIIGVAQLFSGLMFTALVDRCGRRPLIIASSAMVSLCLMLYGFYCSWWNSGAASAHARWVIILLIAAYLFAYNVGLSGLPWIMMSEILPMLLRDEMSSVLTFLNWILSFIIVKTFPKLADTFSIEYVIYAYAALSASCLIFSIRMTPETKNKTLEEIQETN